MVDTVGELNYIHTTYGGLTTTNYYEVTPYNPGTSPYYLLSTTYYLAPAQLWAIYVYHHNRFRIEITDDSLILGKLT